MSSQITLSINLQQGALAFSIIYPLLTLVIKLSVLMLYRRLFTMRIKYFATGWWFNVLFASAFTISVIADALTECKTVSQLWDPNAPPEDCRTESAVSLYVFTVLNGVSDLCILSLPGPVVWGLQMPIRRKIATSCIFLLGFL